MNNNFDINTPPPHVLHTEKIICRQCGQEFEMPPVEQKFFFSKGFTLPKKCPECRKKRKEIHSFTCIDCGEEFTLTGSEIQYYENKGYNLPKRCPSCIKIKKEKNNK